MEVMPVPTQSLNPASLTAEVAIIGDGKISLALASSLSPSGRRVRLWAAGDNIPAEYEIRHRHARVGHFRGRTQFAAVTDKLDVALQGAAVILLSVPATEYSASLPALAPYLMAGQTVVLASAPLGAALQFSRLLGRQRPGLQVNVLEMSSLYDEIKIEGEVALLTGPRRRVSVCGLTRNETRRGLQALSSLWPVLFPASSVLERGFTDVERFVRISLRLFKMLGARASEHRYGSASLNPALISVVSAVGTELKGVAKAYEVSLPSLGQMLADYAGATGRSLEERLQSLSGVLVKEDRGPAVPLPNTQEKLRRDIVETLVLVEEMARLARVPVPVIDSIIELTSVIVEKDIRKEGRGLADLGLVGVDVREIIELVNA